MNPFIRSQQKGSGKQEEKMLNDPAAKYRFIDIEVVILNGLFSGL